MNGKKIENKKNYIVQRSKSEKRFFSIIIGLLVLIMLMLAITEEKIAGFTIICIAFIFLQVFVLADVLRWRIEVSDNKLTYHPTIGKKRTFDLKDLQINMKKNSNSVYSIYSNNTRIFSVNISMQNAVMLLEELNELKIRDL